MKTALTGIGGALLGRKCMAAILLLTAGACGFGVAAEPRAGERGLTDRATLPYDTSATAADTTATAPAGLSDGLVLNYTFSTDEGGIVTDQSGGGHTGRVHSATFAPEGGSYVFNGNGYIEIGGASGDFRKTTEDSFSVSVWVNLANPTNSAVSQVFFGMNDWADRSDSGTFGFALGVLPDGRPELYLGKLCVGTLAEAVAAQPISANAWHQLTAVHSNRTALIYVDGTPSGSIAYESTLAAPVNTHILLGGAIGQATTYLKGKIGETRFYSRALSAQEVVLLYEDGGGAVTTADTTTTAVTTTTTSTAVTTTTTTTTAAAGLSNGLVLHYTFSTDEGSIVTDQSGGGHTGRVHSATFAPEGGSYVFNGNGYIEIGGASGDFRKTTEDSFSVSAWVNLANPTNSAVSQVFFGMNDWADRSDSGAFGFALGVLPDGRPELYLGRLCVGTLAEAVAAQPISANAWHQLTAVHSNRTALIYVDGTPSGSITYESSLAAPVNTHILLGGAIGQPSTYLKGKIGDTRFYNRALSAQEVGLLYTNNAATSPTLSVSPPTLTASCTAGDNATSQYFEVWNSGVGAVKYKITDNATWVSESPTSGTNTGPHSSVKLTYSTAGLATGTYYAAIMVADTNAGVLGSPQTIAVSLSVTSSPSVTIVDNADGPGRVATAGAWTLATSSYAYANTYLQDGNTNKGTKSVTFAPSLPATADYDVYLWWYAGSTRATNVPVDIVHQDGSATMLVNQRLNGSKWNLLGRYHFVAGIAGALRIRTDGTDSGYVNADAVKWVNAGPQDRVQPSVPPNLTATALSGSQIKLTWTASTDNVGVAGYTVRRDGSVVTNVTTTTFTDSGLTPAGTYAYTVEAFDRMGNRSGPSAAVTRQTLLEFIVDNASAAGVTLAGTWTLGSSFSASQGTYLHDGNAAKGAKSLTFRPNLPMGGNYDVYVWYPAIANNATNVPMDVGYLGWVNTTSVNQRVNGGKWNLLGRYTFGAGTNGFVRIRNDNTTSGYVIADAVRFLASTVFPGGGGVAGSAPAAGSDVTAALESGVAGGPSPGTGRALLLRPNLSAIGESTGQSQGSGTSDQRGLRQPWVWANGSLADEYPASNLVDGDTNTLWIGNAGGSPWRVAVDLGHTTDVSAVNLLFYGVPWTNFGLVGSADAATWVDLSAPTNWPVLSRYLFLNLWAAPTDTNPPAIREIIWQGD